jgi:hypothetical protein
MTISLGRRSPDASSGLPGSRYGSDQSAGGRGREDRLPPMLPYLALLPVGFAEPDRSPGLLVSSYLTVSPLPRGLRREAVCFLWHFPYPAARAVGVTHHRTLWSPDFPPRGESHSGLATGPAIPSAVIPPVTTSPYFRDRPAVLNASLCRTPIESVPTPVLFRIEGRGDHPEPATEVNSVLRSSGAKPLRIVFSVTHRVSRNSSR